MANFSVFAKRGFVRGHRSLYCRFAFGHLPRGVVLARRVSQPGVARHGVVEYRHRRICSFDRWQRENFGYRGFFRFVNRQAAVKMYRAAIGDGTQAGRGRADFADRDRAFAERVARFQVLVEFLDVGDDACHFVDCVVAPLGCRAVAGNTGRMHFDLHATAMPTIDAQAGRFGNHHKIGAQAVFVHDVLPAQAIAVFFLYGAGYIECHVVRYSEFFQECACIDAGCNAAFHVTCAAAIQNAILDIA